MSDRTCICMARSDPGFWGRTAARLTDETLQLREQLATARAEAETLRAARDAACDIATTMLWKAYEYPPASAQRKQAKDEIHGNIIRLRAIGAKP